MAKNFAQYDFENRAEFNRILKKASSQIQDLRFPMGEIARDFYQSEKVIFQLKSPGGYPDFKNLASRQNKLRAVGFLYPLLKRKGRLERSITQKGAKDNITIITKKNVVVGTRTPYAGFLQDGTRFMKARRFVFIGPESSSFASKDRARGGGRLTRWSNIIEVYVRRVLEANKIPTRRI